MRRTTIAEGELYVAVLEEIEVDTGKHHYTYYGPYDNKSTAKGVITQGKNNEARYGTHYYPRGRIRNWSLMCTDVNWKTVTD